MTTKILFLGNSHVAVMHRGWPQIKAKFEGLDLTFFAANSTLFNALELDENHVFGVHDARRYSKENLKFLDQVFGTRRIDLKQFDQVVVVGRSIHEIDFLRQFEGYSIDGLCERAGRPRVSRHAFDAFCIEIARKRLPGVLWHNWGTPKLSFLPPPLPQADCPEQGERYGIWARYGANPDIGIAFMKLYRAHVAQLYGRYGMGLLSPPDEVYAENGLTRIKYGDEALRLHPKAGVFGDDDFHHMNTQYGAIVLQHVLQELTARGAGPSQDKIPGVQA